MSDFTLVETRVAKVVCMEDRAQVERRGELELAKGVHRLKAKKLSLLAVDRSLKVEVVGAKLVDAKLERNWLEKPKGGLPADASELRKQLHQLEKRVRELDDDLAAHAARAEVVAQAKADQLRAICEQVGFGQADPAKWRAGLDALEQQLGELAALQERTQRERNLTWQKMEQARAGVAATEQREEDLECALAVTVDAAGGKVALRVSYLVPCAVWRPAYRATLGGDQVRLESEAVVWQRTGEDWEQIELWCSTARPTLGTTPPQLSPDRLSLRPKQQQEKKVVDVAVREEVIQQAGEGGGASELPGLDDGGEARLLKAGAPATIKSDGQPYRVPLAAFEAKAALERVCAPELTPLVSLVARFPNAGGNVLLAGPVDLIRKSGFVGRAQLKFAGAGETVVLSFGSEDTVRVTRQVDEKAEEARLTGRRTTTRTVRLFVSNLSGEAQPIALEERLPVSEVKEVEVRVLDKECRPAPKTVSKEGIARFELDLPPNAQQELRFVWELSAASKVAGV